MSVDVIAPSRLHFGLLSFGQAVGRQFGGAGVMIDQPGLHLRVSPHDTFVASGLLADRVERVMRRFAESLKLRSLPACHIEVLAAPPQHQGLGTGTQLALAVVAGFNALRGNTPQAPAELARLSGRGARSAIGTYGFVHGGLLMESGKLPGESLSPLERRVLPPGDWRFVSVLSQRESGISGDAEQHAFARLPPVPSETAAALREELPRRLFPAAEQGDFAAFSESLYRYGYTAGMCFAAQQGGAFATARVAKLVATIRSLDVAGVGQSSWGPTVFAAVESPAAADRLVERLRAHLRDDERAIVAEVNRDGAIIRC